MTSDQGTQGRPVAAHITDIQYHEPKEEGGPWYLHITADLIDGAENVLTSVEHEVEVAEGALASLGHWIGALGGDVPEQVGTEQVKAAAQAYVEQENRIGVEEPEEPATTTTGGADTSVTLNWPPQPITPPVEPPFMSPPFAPPADPPVVTTPPVEPPTEPDLSKTTETAATPPVLDAPVEPAPTTDPADLPVSQQPPADPAAPPMVETEADVPPGETPPAV